MPMTHRGKIPFLRFRNQRNMTVAEVLLHASLVVLRERINQCVSVHGKGSGKRPAVGERFDILPMEKFFARAGEIYTLSLHDALPISAVQRGINACDLRQAVAAPRELYLFPAPHGLRRNTIILMDKIKPIGGALRRTDMQRFL